MYLWENVYLLKMSCIEKKTTYSIDTRIKFQNMYCNYWFWYREYKLVTPPPPPEKKNDTRIKLSLRVAMSCQEPNLFSTNFTICLWRDCCVVGSLMILSWMFLSSVAIITARYYKSEWRGMMPCGVKVWFAVSLLFFSKIL